MARQWVMVNSNFLINNLLPQKIARAMMIPHEKHIGLGDLLNFNVGSES
jgi:hypothetical protein